MKRASHQYEYRTGDGTRSVAEVRTFGDRWVGSAGVDSSDVGDHGSSEDARAALARALRALADSVERDG